MFETEHPAFGKLQAIGKEITQKVKPKAVVVFSAHWQAGRSSVEVNTAEFTDLIYEFVQPTKIASICATFMSILLI